MQKPYPAPERPFPASEPRGLVRVHASRPGGDITLILGVTARPKMSAVRNRCGPQPLPEISIAPAPPSTRFPYRARERTVLRATGQRADGPAEGYDAIPARTVRSRSRMSGSTAPATSLVAAVSVKGTANGTVYLYGVPAMTGPRGRWFCAMPITRSRPDTYCRGRPTGCCTRGCGRSSAQKAVWHDGRQDRRCTGQHV